MADAELVVNKVQHVDLPDDRSMSIDRESMRQWLRDHDSKIRFVADDFAEPAGVLSSTIKIVVTDTHDVANPYSKVPSVTVGVSGGTAAGPSVDTTQPVEFKELLRDGERVVYEATVDVSVTGTGTLILDLTDSAGTGHDVSDTLTITYS